MAGFKRETADKPFLLDGRKSIDMRGWVMNKACGYERVNYKNQSKDRKMVVIDGINVLKENIYRDKQLEVNFENTPVSLVVRTSGGG